MNATSAKPQASRRPYQSRLSASDTADLCEAAERAWTAAPPRARKVPFTWRGKAFVARSSIVRLMVDTADGEPVCCRYY